MLGLTLKFSEQTIEKKKFKPILESFLFQKDIIHQSSCTITPQQNCIAKRKNHYLLEIARTIMFTNNVPKCLRGDAVLITYYLINRMSTHILNYELSLTCFLKAYLHNQSISSLPLRVFSCTSFIHIHNNDRSKLDFKTQKCIFLGYFPTQKGYKCYSPKICNILYFYGYDIL